MYDLLNTITSPEDLRKLKPEDLYELSKELRQFIIDIVSSNPGHFGASLGVVELTIALHYVYNTPYDRIVWDVGHQAYGHKILTGRRENFHTNRKYQGISGFPKMTESEYDAFGVGHSSTSISAALGMAKAVKHKNEDRQVVAVIGDGAMTAGLAFEGLNNAGIEKSDILVILNDNNIAIDENVGALKEYLLDITTSKTYNKFKDDVWNVLGKISKMGPNAQALASKLDNAIKSTILKHSNLFEAMNFRYFGPVDGHDILHLNRILRDMKRIPGPKLLHCVTKKGKGFRQAELNQTKFHAPGLFNKLTGELVGSDDKKEPVRFQDVFGYTVLDLAHKNEKIVGVTPAMPSGCSLNIMMKEMPDRAYDVGIAEQHAVTFSAGLAVEGMIPFCNIYSSFMQRAYDQLIHDVALQNLHVIFCLDRGGLVGADGATHHGFFDLSYMRIVPNMVVSAPMDEIELRNLMYTAQLEKNKGPFSIRYPRGSGLHPEWRKSFEEIEIGKSRRLSKGEKVAVLTIGYTGNSAAEAIKQLRKEDIRVSHYDMRFVQPLDEEALHNIFKEHEHILTIEDGMLKGGFGSAILEFMADNNYKSNIKRLGIPDFFIEQGTQDELILECGFDTTGIRQTIKELFKTHK